MNNYSNKCSYPRVNNYNNYTNRCQALTMCIGLSGIPLKFTNLIYSMTNGIYYTKYNLLINSCSFHLFLIYLKVWVCLSWVAVTLKITFLKELYYSAGIRNL